MVLLKLSGKESSGNGLLLRPRTGKMGKFVYLILNASYLALTLTEMKLPVARLKPHWEEYLSSLSQLVKVNNLP
jgi:hypothetical protein